MTTNGWGPTRRAAVGLVMLLSLIGGTAGSGMASAEGSTASRVLENHCLPATATVAATEAPRTTPTPRDATPIPFTPTPNVTSTSTSTPTATGTATAMTSTATTVSNTPTDTPTSTPTNTPTDTPTSTPTNTPTNTPTSTPTSTPTFVPVLNPGGDTEWAVAPDSLGYRSPHSEDCVTTAPDQTISVLPSTGQLDANASKSGTAAQIGLGGATVLLMVAIGVMSLRRRRP